MSIKKMKYILLLSFIGLNLVVFYITQKNTQSKIDYSLYHNMHKLEVNYKVFLTTQSQKADVIYETTMQTKNLKKILSEAWQSKDTKRVDELRTQLHKILENRYEKFRKQGLLQYHFVFPNNKVFLRMHKPFKYGDDLTNIRHDFVKVNKTKEIIRGFSQGRTAHAFRNVYPIFDDNNKHIGAIEISYPSEILQENLNKLSEIHSHFLVNKKIFSSKMWSRNDIVLNYEPSAEHRNYLLTLSKTHSQMDKISYFDERISELREQIREKIALGKAFSLISKDKKHDFKVISFYPILQNVTKELSAWIVTYNNTPFIYPAIKDSYFIRVSAFLILGILFYFILRAYTQKGKLSELLKAYDDNVIFSTTDLSGRITKVSKAFCKISGYSKEELLGKPHNIVRHPDMPKEAFVQMWRQLKRKESWKGEVKNLKKDGSYYWVKAKIYPLYNENNKHIGYHAIRHDITHIKEIAQIQKDVIFTMGSIGESRSKETGNHVRRVALYSELLALKYGFDANEAEMLKQASPMHDIGKVAIPDNILKKPGKLTPQEWEVMENHAQIGFDMLKSSDRPLLKTAAIVAHEHHEKWDGSGYPRKLKGEEIHIYGRITAVADVFDALGSNRVYKKAWDDEEIFKLFKEEKGKHFDPKLIDLFFENLDEFLAIRDRFKDEL
ncbi:HD domain-containing phosphohydrolase [Arcobacter sp. YIC-80]|uniref:HD domain-containing phosphohydrolase n=1 Tax=Arcobacter sp. YIC-80 TaxID=3376683 RepID=UPI00384D243D